MCELTVHCAAELLKRAPEYDYLIAPEAKAIPLLYEMARQSGAEKYFIARKGAKAYMSGVFEVEVRSITTMHIQKLVIDKADAEMINGKRILILDDVISTGESLHAMEELVEARRRHHCRQDGRPRRGRRLQQDRHHHSGQAPALQRGRDPEGITQGSKIPGQALAGYLLSCVRIPGAPQVPRSPAKNCASRAAHSSRSTPP